MYRLNGHITEKQAQPGGRERKHRYYAHTYPMPCGDIYLVTPTGEIKAVLDGRDDSVLVWKPKGGLYPHYWKPSTTLLHLTPPDPGELSRICLDDNHRNAFGAPMTDDTLCIMTSPISGLIIRHGVILYEGKMDGRWVPAQLISVDDTERLIIENQWAKDEDEKYLSNGTDPYKHWTWHKKVRQESCGFNREEYFRPCREYAAFEGAAAAYLHQGKYRLYCCRIEGRDNSDCNGSPCSPWRYENTGEVTWAEQTIWGRRPYCDPESNESLSSTCRTTGIVVDKTDGGLPMSNAIQDGRHGFASFQIESRVKRFKWRTWLGKINGETELPGYAELDAPPAERTEHILTDWEAVRNYEITMPDDPPGQNEHAGALLRKGLQTGDCFYNEESDRYWRMEYNGWKEYEGYAARRSATYFMHVGNFQPPGL